jgi:hypothetical protein
MVALRYYLDFDEKSISKILQTPIGTTKSRLHRARERMHRELSAPTHCGSLAPDEYELKRVITAFLDSATPADAQVPDRSCGGWPGVEARHADPEA